MSAFDQLLAIGTILFLAGVILFFDGTRRP